MAVHIQRGRVVEVVMVEVVMVDIVQGEEGMLHRLVVGTVLEAVDIVPAVEVDTVPVGVDTVNEII